MNVQAMVQAPVAMAMERMSDEEVTAQLLALQLGMNPKSRYGYEKISFLFTENDGTKMHSETVDAFTALARRRLGI